jgi:hypothetical protein
MACKQLEVGHFMDGLSEDQRASSIKAAHAQYELAKGFYPADVVPKIEAAWAATLETAETFGYRSGPVQDQFMRY